MNTRSFVLSALIAGFFIALFGNIPVLNLVNCILCLWVWLGGALAVWLYQRFQRGGQALTGSQGALLGAVSGLFGAVIGLPLYIAFSTVLNKVFVRLIEVLQITGDNPFKTIVGTRILVQGLIWFVADLFLYVIFGALAGLITANLLWKKPPLSATTIDVPAVTPPDIEEAIPHPSPVVEAPAGPPAMEVPPEPPVIEAPAGPPAVETVPETPVVEAPPEPPTVETASEWQVAEPPPEPPAPEAPPEPPAS